MSGLQKHHLVEKRFSDLLGVAADEIPSIALTVEEHAKYTARWLEQIARRNMNQPLRTDTATAAKVWEAAQDVYADAPELLEFVKVIREMERQYGPDKRGTEWDIIEEIPEGMRNTN